MAYVYACFISHKRPPNQPQAATKTRLSLGIMLWGGRRGCDSFLDRRVPDLPFKNLPKEQVHVYQHDKLGAGQEELEAKIASLQKVAATFPNRLKLQRMPIAILVPHKRTYCAYANRNTLKLIEEAAGLTGFTVEVLEVPRERNAFFALALDGYKAFILDVRGMDLPEWVFAYVYGRLIPSVKLVRLLRNEVPTEVELPPLVKGLRMDEREPGVESVTYWRDTDDLITQLTRIFHKLDEEQTVLKAGRQSEVYFRTIGCGPAQIFIGNANKKNPLAHQLSNELRLQNIAQFQYKEPDAISPGHNWQERILAAGAGCNPTGNPGSWRIHRQAWRMLSDGGRGRHVTNIYEPRLQSTRPQSISLTPYGELNTQYEETPSTKRESVWRPLTRTTHGHGAVHLCIRAGASFRLALPREVLLQATHQRSLSKLVRFAQTWLSVHSLVYSPFSGESG